MSIALREPPDLTGDAGGIVARRAVVRWAVRLFRREWRQQLLVLGLLTVAVAVTIWGTSTVTNVQLPNPNYATYGTAAVQVTLPGTDPQLAADIAAIAGRWGPADLIESQNIATGTTQSVQLRAENPHGHYNSPLLSLVSGTYPAGPGQVALTSRVADLYGAHVGGTWQAAGTTWRVTGIVQDPSNLADEFALVAPGQVTHPSQVIMLLGSPAVQQAVSNGNAALPGIPAAATVTPPTAIMSGGPSPAVLVLVVEVLGLVFIGLVSVAGFSVMAQRRLRALGMLSAIGATERNLRLVMIVNGLVVGVTAALAGAVLGFAAWFAYVPTLQQATGHVVDAANVPWWAFGIGVVFAIVTSVLASRRPAKTMAAVPVVAALSGRPAPPKAVHRSALPGVIVFAVGVACLAFTGGLAAHRRRQRQPRAAPAGRPGRRDRRDPPARSAGRQRAGRRGGPAAAGRDPDRAARPGPLPGPVRCRARRHHVRGVPGHGDLPRRQHPVREPAELVRLEPVQQPADRLHAGAGRRAGPVNQLSNAQLASLGRQVDSYAAGLHAQSVLPLEASGVELYQVGTQGPHDHFNGSVYVATPQLLATYGIKASQISPGTDILTMRPGLASLPHTELTWGNYGLQSTPGGFTQKDSVLPPCTLSSDCLANPAMQTVSGLPGGTSAPNTVITEYAMSKYHLQPSLNGWLIQAPAPLTATQISAARHLALAYQVTVETKTDAPSLGEFADGATALGIVIALGVLAASVGLIRSETARDLRTLTAAGASAGTRRMITAATAAALGLLGAILGMAGAVIAVLAWAHSSLSAMFGDVPLTDVLILLVGLPLVAAAGGWLLAGREPEAIARQPLD